MKTVLITDDNESFLLSLQDGFRQYTDEFTIVTAVNGQEAVNILNSQKVHLVLTDLKMPKMDGFELVAYLGSHFPAIPIIVMTAFGTPEMEEDVRVMGAFQYIEKPIDFSSMVSKVRKGLEIYSQGYVSGISIPSFLQLLELDKKSCTVTIQSGSQTGYIYFKHGHLINASVGNLTGEEAAVKIINWKNAKIMLTNSCLVTERTINKSLGFLLLGGTTLKQGNSRGNTTTSHNGLDFDLDLPSAEDIFPKTTTSEPPPQPSLRIPSETLTGAKRPTSEFRLEHFIHILNTKPEIDASIIATKGGNILHETQTNDKKMTDFLIYLTMVSNEIRTTLGTHAGRQYTLLNLKNKQRIMVLAGKTYVVGLQISTSADADMLADRIHPMVNKLPLQ